MINLREGILLKLVLVVCVTMQSLVVLPHHHHNGNPAACFNPMHCLASHQEEGTVCSGGHCCDHDHDYDHDHDEEHDIASCNIKIDLPDSVRDRQATVCLPAVALLDAVASMADMISSEESRLYLSTLACRQVRLGPDVRDICVEYLSVALPSRADTRNA